MSENITPFLPRPTTSSTGCRKQCLCVSLCLSLSVTVSLGVLAVVLLGVTTETPVLREEGRVCFVCDYLGSGVESRDTLYQLVRIDGHTFCCLDNKLSEAFQEVIAVGSEDKTDIPDDRSSLFVNRSQEVGAHFYLNYKLSTDTTLTWDRGRHRGISFNSGIHCREGSMIMPSAGRYLIYSHITFEQRRRDSKGHDSFVHRITRQHPRQPNLGERTLLQNKESFSQEITSPGSSYLTAVLQLHKYDHISVRISDLKSVSHKKPLSNYFGVLKLS